MDYLLEHTVHHDKPGMSLQNEIFTELHFVNNAALLAETLEVLVLAVTFMQEEVAAFGLQINWFKTKILQSGHVESIL